MLCKHHFSKNGQVFFHIFWVVTLIMQSRNQTTNDNHLLSIALRLRNEEIKKKQCFIKNLFN
ncbi:hypothetical protein EQK34_16785 [Lacticaseibacillus paracasei]|nr:hypothetical protein EQK34_16785 [Lacticaseibacillus paracasei]